MRLTLLFILLCALGVAPVRGDAPAPHPRGQTARPSAVDPPPARRTGRMPAVIQVSPPGGAAPTHLVVTIPSDRLASVLRTPVAVGQAAPVDAPPGGALRHVLGAAFLSLAVLSVPWLWSRRLRRSAVVALALTVTAGTVLVRADIAAPRPRPAPPAPGPAPTPTPQTVEVVIVPGAGPVQVQVTYARP